MKSKFKLNRDNVLVIVIVFQFILISIGGNFIYKNYNKNLAQSTNIMILDKNSQKIKNDINSKVQNTNIELSQQMEELSATLTTQSEDLDSKILRVNSNLSKKINDIPQGPVGPQGPRGPRGLTGATSSLSNSDKSLLTTVDLITGTGWQSWSRWNNRDLLEIDNCLTAITDYLTLSWVTNTIMLSFSCSN
jgi:hypothetical protein